MYFRWKEVLDHLQRSFSRSVWLPQMLQRTVGDLTKLQCSAVMWYHVLTLSEGVQWQAGLSRLDREQPLPLKVEQMLLLDLLDLQELLLEGQLLCWHLLLMVHTQTHTHKERQRGTPSANMHIYKSITTSANMWSRISGLYITGVPLKERNIWSPRPQSSELLSLEQQVRS